MGDGWHWSRCLHCILICRKVLHCHFMPETPQVSLTGITAAHHTCCSKSFGRRRNDATQVNTELNVPCSTCSFHRAILPCNFGPHLQSLDLLVRSSANLTLSPARSLLIGTHLFRSHPLEQSDYHVRHCVKSFHTKFYDSTLLTCSCLLMASLSCP